MWSVDDGFVVVDVGVGVEGVAAGVEGFVAGDGVEAAGAEFEAVADGDVEVEVGLGEIEMGDFAGVVAGGLEFPAGGVAALGVACGGGGEGVGAEVGFDEAADVPLFGVDKFFDAEDELVEGEVVAHFLGEAEGAGDAEVAASIGAGAVVVAEVGVVAGFDPAVDVDAVGGEGLGEVELVEAEHEEGAGCDGGAGVGGVEGEDGSRGECGRGEEGEGESGEEGGFGWTHGDSFRVLMGVRGARERGKGNGCRDFLAGRGRRQGWAGVVAGSVFLWGWSAPGGGMMSGRARVMSNWNWGRPVEELSWRVMLTDWMRPLTFMAMPRWEGAPLGEAGVVVDEERGVGEGPRVHGAEGEEGVSVEGGADFPLVIGGGLCGGGDAVELLFEEGAEKFFDGPGGELVLCSGGPAGGARADVVGGLVEGIGEGNEAALEPEVGDGGGRGGFGGGVGGFGENGGERFAGERFDGGGGEGGEEERENEESGSHGESCASSERCCTRIETRSGGIFFARGGLFFEVVVVQDIFALGAA